MSDSVGPHRRQPTRLPRPWDSPGKNTGVGCHFLLQCMKVKSESEVTTICRIDKQLPTSVGSYKTQGDSRKTSISASFTMLNILTVWITTNCGKFFKRWEYQTTYLPPDKSVRRSRNKLEPDMEQWTGSKSGKEYIKVVFYHPAYLTYMQSTSCKMLRLMKPKLESRLLGETSITSDMQMPPPYGRK